MSFSGKRSTLKLKRRDLDTIYRYAEEAYPHECCGLLTDRSSGEASQLHPCRNIQDRLHAEDPEQYPRNSRIGYFIDLQELYAVISTAERSGGKISGIYHSHVNRDAYFSDDDRERAMVGGEPAYAGAVYLVVSVFDRRVRGHSAFAWDEKRRDFVEVHVEIVE